jgi:hypothetical protein
MQRLKRYPRLSLNFLLSLSPFLFLLKVYSVREKWDWAKDRYKGPLSYTKKALICSQQPQGQFYLAHKNSPIRKKPRNVPKLHYALLSRFIEYRNRIVIRAANQRDSVRRVL